MPAKNSIKEFVANNYYHLYNRGVEKRKIFLDEQDYHTFLSYLKDYLLPKDKTGLQLLINNPLVGWKVKNKVLKQIQLNNFSQSLKLLAFCLMPNHFHFLIKQREKNTIDVFMNSFCTRYSMFFNKKYKRVGKLFQGVYKAVRVITDEQLLHLSRYIHRNPLTLKPSSLQTYSSYQFYIGNHKVSWVKPEDILSYFSKTNLVKQHKSYKSFTEDISLTATSQEYISKLIFD